MPLSGASRWFLSAAIAHLAAAGILLLFEPETLALTLRWDLWLWLVLIGFVQCSTLGFSLHLFPAVSHRLRAKGPAEGVAFLFAESSVVFGVFALSPLASGFGSEFSLAALFDLAAIGLVLSLFVRAVLAPRLRTPGPEVRPGDSVTVPLFLVAWSAALVAAALFVLSGLSEGPGFGWWLAAVHLFVLGHATVLIAAVSLRLTPRSLDADPPKLPVALLAGLGTVGAALVPTGMLVLTPSEPMALALFAAPEAAFAVLFVGLLAHLGVRTRRPRRQLGLHLAGVVCLLAGGGLGLWMVSAADFGPVETHALVNVFGFVGLTIVIMWFGMIAPFQRISHAWTRRMLWGLSAGWLAAVGVLASAEAAGPGAQGIAIGVGGALLLAVALGWGAGTIPVLFPKLNPLPGVTGEELRAIRDRWPRR